MMLTPAHTVLLLGWIGLLCLDIRRSFARPLDPSKAEEYLTTYGHLQPPAPNSPSEVSDRDTRLRRAIRSYQDLVGLNITGELDADTLEWMGKDRCGVPDNVGQSEYVRKRRRRRRYVAQGSKWPTNNLLYYFQNYTRKLNVNLNRQIVSKAFQFWTNVTKLVVSETTSDNSANIKLLYAVRAHGDNWPFDGPKGVLAHAFFPDSGGDAHFDDDEDWSDKSNSGTNLLQVTTHELGHSLGLGHSSVPGAVMAPTYDGYIQDFQLSQDDINGIRYLYGYPGDQTSSSTASTLPSTMLIPVSTMSSTALISQFPSTTVSPEMAQFCANGTVDAIVSVEQITYAFQGAYYAVLNSNGIAPGYPRLISKTWPDLPNYLDSVLYLEAVIERDSSGNFVITDPAHLFFFKGKKYWRYNNTFNLDADYPKPIKDGFPGIPDNLDASFVWSGNGKIYFIKGADYYRYTRWRGADSTYPRTLAVWRGLPNHVDAAFQWTNSRTYFFSGKDFYRFDDINFYTDDGYPKSIAAAWFGCSGSNLQPGESMKLEAEQAKDQFNVVTNPQGDPKPRQPSFSSDPSNQADSGATRSLKQPRSFGEFCLLSLLSTLPYILFHSANCLY